MSTSSVTSPFDPESCQAHLRSERAFRRWEFAARVHHLIAGHVLRDEFLAEWLSGREYSSLLAAAESPP